jgi:AcrR family transcriptional regulator
VKPNRPELPREFVAERKRHRITDAMAELSAEQGYEATKIGDLVRRAGVARKTLYDNFDGKEEVFLAAFDSAVAEAMGRVEEACAAGGEWSRRVEAGLRAFLSFVAEKPAAARMCVIEAVSATPAASARYDQALEGFVELWRRSAPAEADLPETIGETLVGGVAWIVYQQIRRDQAEQALDLLPGLSEFVLSPYHGVSELSPEPGGESNSTVADSNS